MSRVPNEKIDYTSRDYESFKKDMINFLRVNMPEYTDLSETDAGIVILEALANGLDILSLYLDNVANDVFLPTTQDRKTAVVLARGLGYTPYNQGASEFPQIFVKEFELDDNGDRITEDSLYGEEVIIPKGTVVTTVGNEEVEPVPFETTKDLIIPANSWGDETDRVTGAYKYSVIVRNMTSIERDEVGVSNGTSFQNFTLSYLFVLTDTIEVYAVNPDDIVDESDLPDDSKWKQVDSFVSYGPEDKVYRVTVDEFDNCLIEFGNGVNGMIPSVDSQIICNYAIGGGTAGNVDPHSITEIDSIPDGNDFEGTTFNTEISKMGYEKESLDSIKINAPANFRMRGAIITSQDYADRLKIVYPNKFKDILAIRSPNDERHLDIYYVPMDDYAVETLFRKEIKQGCIITYTLSQSSTISAPSYITVNEENIPVIGVKLVASTNVTATLYVPDNVKFVDLLSSHISVANNTVYVKGTNISKYDVEVYSQDTMSVVLTQQTPAITDGYSHSSLYLIDGDSEKNNYVISDGTDVFIDSSASIGYLLISANNNVVYAHRRANCPRILTRNSSVEFHQNLSESRKIYVEEIDDSFHYLGMSVKGEDEIISFLKDNSIMGTSFSLIPSIKQIPENTETGHSDTMYLTIVLDSKIFNSDGTLIDDPTQNIDDIILIELGNYFNTEDFKIGQMILKSSIEATLVDIIDGLLSIRITHTTDSPVFSFKPKCAGEVFTAPKRVITDKTFV